MKNLLRTFSTPAPLKRILRTALSFALLVHSAGLSAQKTDEVQTELRTKADLLFEAGDFDAAAPLYSQLLSLSPKDTLLSFQFGACLAMSPAKSRSAISYLEPALASKRPPKDLNYFYGRALMAEGRFKDAADAFRGYSSGARERRSEAEGLLVNCENAISLSGSQNTMPVISEREITIRNFFSAYEFVPKGGKVVPSAEQFLSKAEREKLFDPVMFISGDQQTIYLAKLARGSSDHTDIHIVIRQSNGQWSDAVPLVSSVNSEYSENYPFLDRSGSTLYFSSKGFNSIGGYDIFRSDYDFSSGGWSAPTNMGLGVNTIGDDMLFVPSADGSTASYVTTDRAEDGKAFFRTVELPRGKDRMVQVKGFYRSADQQMRRDARISIVRQNDRALVATANTDDRTGQYSLNVPASGDYYLVVEGGGYVPHIERFSIPEGVDMSDIKQSVIMDRSGNDEKMQVKNYFRSTSEQLLASEEPSETISRTYVSSEVDSSELVPIRIGDVTLMLPEPESMVGDADVETSSPIASAADGEAGNDNTDIEADQESRDLQEQSPVLEDPIRDKSGEVVADEVLADSEVDKVIAETQNPAQNQDDPFVQPDISDEDLARLAMEDARDSRDEAAELRQEAEAIRSQASEKRSLASSLVEGIDLNDSVARSKNRTVVEQAEDLEEVAVLSETRAAQLDSMAMERELSAEFSEREAARLTRKEPLASTRSSRKKSIPAATGSTSPDILTTTAKGPSSDVTKETVKEKDLAQEVTVPETASSNVEAIGQDDPAAAQLPAPVATESSASGTGQSDGLQNRSLTVDLITGEKSPVTTEAVSDEAYDQTARNTVAEELESPSTVNTAITSGRDAAEDAEGEPVNSDPSEKYTAVDSESPSSETDLSGASSDPVSSAISQTERSGDIRDEQSSVAQVKRSGGMESQVSTQTESGQPASGEVVMTEEGVSVAAPGAKSETTESGDAVIPTSNATANASEVITGNSSNASATSPSEKASAAEMEAREKKQSEPVMDPVEAKTETPDPSGSDLAAGSNVGPTESESVTGAVNRASVSDVTSASEEIRSQEPDKNRPIEVATEAAASDNRQAATSVSDENMEGNQNAASSSTSQNSSQGRTASSPQAITVTAEDVAALRQIEFDDDLQVDEEQEAIESPGSVPAVTAETENTRAEDDSVATADKVTVWIQSSLENKRKAEVLDRQSNFLRQKTEELPEGEERDSVLQLSYEFGSEATRLYSLADRQMMKARSMDLAAVQQITGTEQLRAQDQEEEFSDTDAPTAEALAVTDRINNSGQSAEQARQQTQSVEGRELSDSESRFDAPSSGIDSDNKGKSVSEESEVEQDGGFTIPIRYTDQTKYSDKPTTPVATNSPAAKNQSKSTPSPATPQQQSKEAVEGTDKDLAASSSEYAPRKSQNGRQAPANAIAVDSAVPSTSESTSANSSEAVEPVASSAENTTSDDGEIPGGGAAATPAVQEPSVRFANEDDEKRYQQLTEQADAGRQQTIDAFSEAVRLNKEAVTARETYLSTLKAADEATDSVRRMELLDQSETLLELSVKNEEAARVKYAEAQQITRQVEELSTEAESLTLESKSAKSSGQSVSEPSLETPSSMAADEPLVLLSKTPDGVSAYTSDRPIPRDPPLPQGLVFKVQIGAFRKPIPESTFGGLRPLTAENSRPGWIRYCIGVFKAFEPANLVKKEMRRMGFKDAFVVAYLDGKRVSLSQAYALINAGGPAEKSAYAVSLKEETASLRKLDIVASRYPKVKDTDEDGFYGTSSKTSLSVESASGVTEYAVQVGVYRTDVAPAVLATLQPLQTELIRERLYRFTTGRFQEYGQADSLRLIAVGAGVKDAFVVAYRDGNRVSVTAEARKKRVEPVPVEKAPSTPPVVDANVTETPGPLMATSGVIFRVQIGAFRQNVPFEVVDAFLKISDQGIEREKDERGLQIFYAGKYGDFDAAVAAKDQAIQRGVKDAFVVAFQDGKRVSLDVAREAAGR